jgi:DNA-directed RNA polymerase alpha subunit
VNALDRTDRDTVCNSFAEISNNCVSHQQTPYEKLLTRVTSTNITKPQPHSLSPKRRTNLQVINEIQTTKCEQEKCLSLVV